MDVRLKNNLDSIVKEKLNWKCPSVYVCDENGILFDIVEFIGENSNVNLNGQNIYFRTKSVYSSTDSDTDDHKQLVYDLRCAFGENAGFELVSL